VGQKHEETASLRARDARGTSHYSPLLRHPSSNLSTVGRTDFQPLAGMPRCPSHHNRAEERRAEEGQSVVVVPSNAGKKHHPAWYFNLRANPLPKVQLGSEIRTVRAREATSEERERPWSRLVTYYGGFQVYRERTKRHIPVVILDPV
jgi:deazaflavin-dependent oxidoreductase (nitroreductase family)